MLIQIPLVWLLLAAAPAEQAVLAKMDKSAAAFRSMSGKIRKVTHTAIIDENSVESGIIHLKRQGTRDMRLLVDISEPDPKSYALKERKAEIYYPKIQTVQEYDLGKQSELLDQFLLSASGPRRAIFCRSTRSASRAKRPSSARIPPASS